MGCLNDRSGHEGEDEDLRAGQRAILAALEAQTAVLRRIEAAFGAGQQGQQAGVAPPGQGRVIPAGVPPQGADYVS